MITTAKARKACQALQVTSASVDVNFKKVFKTDARKKRACHS
jgi:hypothetical protein